MKPHNPEIQKELCWGMLLHMLGLSDESRERLREIPDPGDGPLKELAGLLQEYDEGMPPDARSGILVAMVDVLGKVLDPDNYGVEGPRLSKESPRCYEHRQAKDSSEDGYSRDPFKEIKEGDKPWVALAAISYLVRSHALCFCRPRRRRDFNAGKVALNDILQATQLGSRLYYSLPVAVTKVGDHEQYFGEVAKGPDLEGDPWDSPFFIWCVLQLVEIQRGNIYRQVEYIEEADRRYKHAQVRLDRLCSDPLELGAPNVTGPADHYFITSTMVRALFERSKILFDRGLFIESMINQLRSVGFLVRMATVQEPGTAALPHKDLDRITKTLKFLDVVRKQSVWDRERIAARFGYPSKVDLAAELVISPGQFTQYLAELSTSNVQIAVEIFARLGFTLYMLRQGEMALGRWTDTSRKNDLADQQENRKRLPAFFDAHKEFQAMPKHKDVKPAALGQYCSDFIMGAGGAEQAAMRGEIAFEDRLERRLAHRLHQEIGSKRYEGDPLSEIDFYRTVFSSVTQNIGNLLTIPRRIHSFLMRSGYIERRSEGDLSGKTVYESIPEDLRRRSHRAKKDSSARSSNAPQKNGVHVDGKVVVLRRWQSYNPKVPRPYGTQVKGGGYYLLWHGRGIVIDPGYDFIQNFYDEGFSLNDIHAVVVTHSHPDHDDDISSLTTLVVEWNEYHRRMGFDAARLDRLDLFLNESTHLKFSDWLRASGLGIGRVVPLPLLVWNMDSQSVSERPRGNNVTLELRRHYGFDMEVVPAWHDDVIGKTAAVGVKFHLYAKGEKGEKVGILGYTGDTGLYGRGQNGTSGTPPLLIKDNYEDCDILIAHLGDIKLRELATILQEPPKGNQRPHQKNQVGDCISNVLADWFCDPTSGVLSEDRITSERVEAFLRLLVVLGVADDEALNAKIKTEKDEAINAGIQAKKDESRTVSGALRYYIDKEKLKLQGFSGVIQSAQTLEHRLPRNPQTPREEATRDQMSKIIGWHVAKAFAEVGKNRARLEDAGLAYVLLAFLCASSLDPWHYPYHLGISGIYELHRAMVGNTGKKGKNRVFVIGELPEELASYRHHVARLLNVTEGQGSSVTPPEDSGVRCFTGDIGLHIKLATGDDGQLDPRMRCTYCNYNNETVLAKRNYHTPDKIIETPLHRLDSAMIYLCTEHDHHPEAENRPCDFLSRPDLRVI